jgi:formamidopyrimidine-DNA glycosylase
MPELPEVETNARNLARWAVGRRIVAVTAPPGTRETGGVTKRKFIAALRGRRVESVERRGKWILVTLDRGALGLHLGMTGKIASGTGEPPRFTRAILELDDGRAVWFVDMRRFGKLHVAKDRAALEARAEIRSVGPDAFHIAPDALAAALKKTRRTVKEAIMDQTILAGVGNLYAAEALFRARIHPLTPAARTDAAALLRAIRAALRHGLRTYDGADLPEYIEEGARNPFYVYDRQGKPCRRCKTTLEAITIGGRVSAYCPSCQPRRSGRTASRAGERRRAGRRSAGSRGAGVAASSRRGRPRPSRPSRR